MKTNLKWPCRFCHVENKSLGRRRIHENACPERIKKLRESQAATLTALETRYGKGESN